MSRLFKILQFFIYFGMGLLQPVMTLFLLEKGCSLQTVPLVMAVYTVSVLAMEVPSGVFADVKGRKKSFIMSNFINIVSYLFFAFSQNIVLLAIGMIFMGVGRAFSSGSLEALMVEQSSGDNGENMVAATSDIFVWQCIGLTAGALCGGLLPKTSGYVLHIIISAGVRILTSIVCVFGVKEKILQKGKNRSSLKSILATTGKCLQESVELKVLLIGMMIATAIIYAIQTYWQPVLAAFSGYRSIWAGVLCAGGFLTTAVSMFIIGKKATFVMKYRYLFYFSTLAGMGILIILVGLSSNIWLMGLTYLMFYFMLGLNGIPEQTILNTVATDENRATILSVASFLTQAGTLLIGGMCSGIVNQVGVQGIWIYAGIIAIALTVVIAIILKRKLSNTIKAINY